MREKTARPKDIDRYINFLKDIKFHSIGGEYEFAATLNFKDYVKAHGVSKSIEFALKKLGAITIRNETKWTYEWGEPTKQHALQILDFLLSWRKKKEQQPLLSDDWKTIVEKLTSISSDLKELLKPADLMIGEIDVDRQQRFELIKSIAGGVFNSFESLNEYQSLGHRVIVAADHILKELKSERFNN